MASNVVQQMVGVLEKLEDRIDIAEDEEYIKKQLENFKKILTTSLGLKLEKKLIEKRNENNVKLGELHNIKRQIDTEIISLNEEISELKLKETDDYDSDSEDELWGG